MEPSESQLLKCSAKFNSFKLAIKAIIEQLPTIIIHKYVVDTHGEAIYSCKICH